MLNAGHYLCWDRVGGGDHITHTTLACGGRGVIKTSSCFKGAGIVKMQNISR